MLASNRWKACASAVVVSVAVAGGAGCGSDDDGNSDARKDVRAVYGQLQSRFEARDSQGVCARISKAAKRQVGSLGHAQPTTCARDVRQLFKWIKRDEASAGTPRKLVRIAVDGDEASGMAQVTATAQGRIVFVKEDGEWKLDNFFGITAPPPPDML